MDGKTDHMLSGAKDGAVGSSAAARSIPKLEGNSDRTARKHPQLLKAVHLE